MEHFMLFNHLTYKLEQKRVLKCSATWSIYIYIIWATEAAIAIIIIPVSKYTKFSPYFDEALSKSSETANIAWP